MILQVLSSSRGGAATHVLALTQGLAAAGDRVGVVMPLDGGNVTRADIESCGALLVPYTGVRQLARDFARLQPQVVHAHGSRAAFWTWLALLLSRSPAALYYSIHGFVTPFHPQPRRALQLLAERLVSARCRALVADAQAERREVVRFGLAPPEKVRTIYLGFDLAPYLALTQEDRTRARRELAWDDDTWHLLNICRLDRPRDFSTLLRALRELSGAVHLHIVGGGPLESAIKREIDELGLGSKVTMWGLVPSILPFYAAADAFVLTSWGWEGCPVTVIEAQAAGLPAIATDAGGTGEALGPERSANLVPRRHPQRLAQALEWARAEPQQAAAGGRAYAEANFTRERMVERMRALYSQGVSRGTDGK